MQPEELSIEKAASLLGVSEGVIERWCKQGVIPSHRQKTRTFFFEEELLEWGKSRHIFSISNPLSEDSASGSSLKLAMMRGGVYPGIEGDGVSELYWNGLNKIVFLEDVDLKLAHKMLMERESMATTAVGKGISLPHPRTPDLLNLKNSYVSTFFYEEAHQLQAHDGEPVFCAFFILATDITTHLQLMGQLARAIHNPGFFQALQIRASLNELLIHLNE